MNDTSGSLPTSRRKGGPLPRRLGTKRSVVRMRPERRSPSATHIATAFWLQSLLRPATRTRDAADPH
jgi:hypothetical protein